MKRKVKRKAVAAALILALTATGLTGCRFGFASDPDDPNQEAEKEPAGAGV